MTSAKFREYKQNMEAKLKRDAVRTFFRDLLKKTNLCKADMNGIRLPDAYIIKSLLNDSIQILDKIDLSADDDEKLDCLLPASIPSLSVDDLQKMDDLLSLQVNKEFR